MVRKLPFIASKIFAVILFLYELFVLLLYIEAFGFLSSIQSFVKYAYIIPNSFGAVLMWLFPHWLLLVIMICFWLWEERDEVKYAALGALVIYTIFNAILYVSIITLILWFFTLYLIIRKPVKIISIIINKIKKVDVNKVTQQLPAFQRKWHHFVGFGSVLLLIIPTIFFAGEIPQKDYSWNFEYPEGDFTERKNIALIDAIAWHSHEYATQLLRAYVGYTVVEDLALSDIDEVYGLDGGDFTMNWLIRLLYLDNKTNVLSNETKNTIEEALLSAKYWDHEVGETKAIYWTENHQIAYHTAELLAGQLYPTKEFYRSNITGEEHITHAEYRINKWIDWRARFGFSEYHSNSYLNKDIMALLNLVEYAENSTIALKASMLLDLICFDFANNYFKDIYATAQGRCYEKSKVSYKPGYGQKKDRVTDTAWLLLGLGGFDPTRSIGPTEVFLLTTDKYTPPPILEHIALDAKDNNEHKDRNSMTIDEGYLYNITYDEEDLMYWWGMSGYFHPKTINATLAYIEKYDINTAYVYGGDIITDYAKFTANVRRIDLSELLGLVDEFSVGIAMEAANTYTYRTPYYQLSGLQDYQKGLNSVQEHVWQASLSNHAYVFTNAPGGANFKGGLFMGGWMPKSTFYKNIGIIQYDHKHDIFAGRILNGLFDSAMNLFGGNRPRNHAYFPRWAFDEVVSKGKWTFGSKDGGFVALYSKRPTFWATNYELVALGKTNTWIVEMGSIDEYASFENFIQKISSSEITIKKTRLGFSVSYNSPSQGLATVGWDDDFIVNGTVIDLEYERFENSYTSFADFGSMLTVIEFGTERLTLDFENLIRLYETW